MAAAFLLNEEQEVLFLKKWKQNAFLASFFVPIGGHLEGDEINAPLKACTREIAEETGLQDEAVENLRLRYIVLRHKEVQEIRIQYVFFGTVRKDSHLVESDEGSLHWVSYREIPNLNVSATTPEIAKHYRDVGRFTENIYVGSMKSSNGKPDITWILLEDWEFPI